MPVSAIVEERYRSVSGDDQTMRVGCLVQRVASEDEAIQATREYLAFLGRGAAPPYPYDFLSVNPQQQYYTGWNTHRVLINVQVEEVNCTDTNRTARDAEFHTVATYGFRATCPIINRDYSTGQSKVYQGLGSSSVQQIVRDPGGNMEVDFGGAIEVDMNGSWRVNGTDKLEPAVRFSITWNPLNFILDANGNQTFWYSNEHMRWLGEFVAKPNRAAFLGIAQPDTSVPYPKIKENPGVYDIGEVMCIGIQDRIVDQRNGIVEMRYTFEVRPNQEELTIDGLTFDNPVRGWNHVWGPRPLIDSGTPQEPTPFLIPQYTQLTEERIYDFVDLAYLFYSPSRVFDGTLERYLMVPQCPGFRYLPRKVRATGTPAINEFGWTSIRDPHESGVYWPNPIPLE